MNYHRLRFKINAAILTTFAVITAFAAIILYPFEIQRRHSRLEEIQTLLDAVFQQKREELANEIFARQESAMRETLSQMQETKGIERISIYLPEGGIFFATHYDSQRTLTPAELTVLNKAPAFAKQELGEGAYAVYSRVIQVLGERIGYIKIYFNLDKLEKESGRVLFLFAVLFSSTLVIMIIILNLMLSRSVIRPVSTLRKAIGKVQKGQLGQQVVFAHQDEIGEMYAAFNEMSTRLYQQHHDLTQSIEARDHYFRKLEETNRALEELNVSLERMVEDRTRELVRSNEKLHQEINERKRADHEKKELETRLARSQKMEALGLLAGGVAHDLNNVLSGLVSYPDIILTELPESSPLVGPVQTIRKSGQKAAAIVQDLLTLARRGITQTSVLNLNKDVITDYLNSPEYLSMKTLHPKIRVRMDLAPDLLNIRGSAVHLLKTVMNLMLNAAQAQPDGGVIEIKTENRYVDRPLEGYDHVEEGDYVLLEVSDQGAGIAKDDLNRIFEPFYTKKVMGRGGTGLGMAVVWGAVQDHQGYINVWSELGRGTVFELYFPVTRDAVGDTEESPMLADYIGKGERVLVIDDVAEQREIAAALLSRLAYTVVAVPSGEAALDYLKDRSVDVLVLDMIMDPGMDGLDTYRHIIRIHPGQKAVITSGFAESDRVREAQRLGAGEYIKKPYTMEKIGMALKTVLGP